MRTGISTSDEDLGNFHFDTLLIAFKARRGNFVRHVISAQRGSESDALSLRLNLFISIIIFPLQGQEGKVGYFCGRHLRRYLQESRL